MTKRSLDSDGLDHYSPEVSCKNDVYSIFNLNQARQQLFRFYDDPKRDPIGRFKENRCQEMEESLNLRNRLLNSYKLDLFRPINQNPISKKFNERLVQNKQKLMNP